MRLSALLLLCLICPVLNAGTPSWTALGWNGRGCDADVVDAVKLSDGSILLGGIFSACGDIDVSAIARFDPASGQFLPFAASDGLKGSVYRLLRLGNDLYVGGDTMRIPGLGGTWGFAHLRLDTGQWSAPVQAMAQETVSDMVELDGDIFVATRSGGSVFRFAPSTATVTQIVDSNSSISDLHVDGAQLLVTGFFTEVDGTSASNIARFDPQLDSWSALGGGLSGQGLAIATDTDAVYASGSFTSVAGQPTDRVARFDRLTESWEPIGQGTVSTGSVRTLAIVGGDLFAGGEFTAIDGIEAASVARFNAIEQRWEPLGQGLTGIYGANVAAIEPIDGELYVGGRFQRAGGEPQSGIARFRPSSEQWLPLGSGLATSANGGVDRTLPANGNVVLVGGFSEVGGISASQLAVMDCSNFQVAPLGGIADHQINGLVYAATFHQGWLYIGGDFSTIAGEAAPFLARFHDSTGQWQGLGADLDGQVRSLYADGDDLYVSGFFQNVGAVPARGIARLSLPLMQWHTLGAGAQNGTNGFIEAIHRAGDGIFVGGSFNEVAGQSAGNLARYAPATDSWSVPNGSFNDFVFAIEYAAGDLYVGGLFQAVNGQSAGGLAKLDLATGTWSAPGEPVQSFFTHVYSFQSRNGQLLVGGQFSSLANVSLNGIGSLDLLTQEWSALGEGVEVPGLPFLPSGLVGATAACGDQIVVGGGFQRAGGQTSTSLALLKLPGPIFVNGFE